MFVDHLVKPSRQALVIDGRSAELLTSPHEIVLRVPRVLDGVSGTVPFSMALIFDREASRDLALRIMKSIEFKPPA